MKYTLNGNMLIAQSGGPTMVINQSVIAAVIEAKKKKEIGKIYGALHGIQGMLDEKFIDLCKQSKTTLESVAATPSSALGTVRKKPTSDECRRIIEVLRKYNIRYFFYIGGNDSAETAYIISQYAKRVNYKICCIHIPKTIDNDLCENDHTPGFGSAAKFVACAVMGDNLDNRALPGVKIDVVMGRHAGFLAASSVLGRVYPDDGPHLIYLPERPFSMSKYIKEVKSVYSGLGRCVVVVSEGIRDKKGKAIATKFIRESDSHGNIQLSGSGALGDLLAAQIKNNTNIRRVRADTFGYLQRSFPALVSKVDVSEAKAVGTVAIKTAVLHNVDGSIVICRETGKRYKVHYKLVPLKKVAKTTRSMPAKFINKAGNNVTKAYLEYARPIIGQLPKVGRFTAVL